MLFANNANTTLASSLTNVATTMSVTSASAFPSPTGSQYFYCTLADAATQTTIEIVKVTAISGTTFTIVRGQDGTSGTAFSSGAVVSLRLVRASLNDFPKLDETNTFTFAPTFNTALAVGSGGTGLTSLTANYIPYGNGTSAFSSSASFNFDGTKMGIGTSAPNSQLEVNGGILATGSVTLNTSSLGLNIGNAASAQTGSVTGFVVADAGGYGGYNDLIIGPRSDTGNFGNIRFYTGNAERMRLFPSGGFSIGNTTDPGAGVLSVNNGIKFSNGSALVNSTLNDYETGTWTPNQGSGLTVVGAFSSSGKYTKIGNQVTVVGILTGATSILVAQYGTLLTNLPFSNNSSLQSIGTLVNSYQASTSPFYTSTAAPTNLNSMMATTATPSIWFSITYTATF